MKIFVNANGHTYADPVTFTELYFPLSLGRNNLTVESLISDYAGLFGFNRNKFKVTYYSLPHAYKQASNTSNGFECHIESNNDEDETYTVHIADDLIENPRWLVSSLAYQFSRLSLIVTGADLEEDEGSTYFSYVYAVFCGFGILILQNDANAINRQYKYGETRWSYMNDIPYSIMIYSLAVLARLNRQVPPDWRELLPSDLKEEFDLCIQVVNQVKGKPFNHKRQAIAQSIREAYFSSYNLYQAGEFESAVNLLEQVVPIAPKDTAVLNNLGYFKLRLERYEESIEHFRTLLKINPIHSYALDNLGFALIMTGDLKNGFEYVQKAIRSNNNDDAYSFRNLALYYQGKGDFEQAAKYFDKSFKQGTPVDLLDYFYGSFLIKSGKKDEGLRFLRSSAKKGEPEATRLLASYESEKH